MATPEAPAMPERDMAAAELALGVLDGEERAAALRRVLAEPAFAREVEQWRARLVGLFADWPATEPGPDAARRAATIPGGGQRDTGARWRWLAAVSSIAAALLLGLLVLRPAPAPRVVVAPAPVAAPAPPLVAVISPKGGAAAFGAVFDPATREVRMGGAVAVPAGRVAELWAIGGDGVPRAAGLMPAGGGGRVVVARGVAVAAGTVLAVSIEPPGGSPKPGPTGPVVATGALAII